MLTQNRTGLKRVIPDCLTGRVLIQSNVRTGEPELHYLKLPQEIEKHDGVLLLDPQVSQEYPFTLIAERK
jgi:uridine kinase